MWIIQNVMKLPFQTCVIFRENVTSCESIPAIVTSLLRQNDVILTSKWRRFGVIMTLLLRDVLGGMVEVSVIIAYTSRMSVDGVVTGNIAWLALCGALMISLLLKRNSSCQWFKTAWCSCDITVMHSFWRVEHKLPCSSQKIYINTMLIIRRHGMTIVKTALLHTGREHFLILSFR